jgi:hypothetical protein
MAVVIVLAPSSRQPCIIAEISNIADIGNIC